MNSSLSIMIGLGFSPASRDPARGSYRYRDPRGPANLSAHDQDGQLADLECK
jgi:hypothetical protein